MRRMSYIVVVALLSSTIAISCASNPRPRSAPLGALSTLIAFQGAVSERYLEGGMELEHFNFISVWLANGIRILQVNQTQWEGQARLEWPKVRSLCGPYDSLTGWVNKTEALLQ
jgi:hypothetical protein